MCRNRPFSAKAGKAHSTPPKETSRQASKRIGAPSRRPNAARTRSSGRVHAVPISAAASRTARVDLSVAAGGCGAGAFSDAEIPGSSGPVLVSRPCWIALRTVSSLRCRCSATSLGLQPAPSNCCAWAVTSGVSPTSALWCEEPLENQGPVDFSVTMRLASLPGFYWTYDLCRHPKRLVQNPLIWLGCPATTNPQNSVLVGRQNDRRDLVLRQQVAHRPP